MKCYFFFDFAVLINPKWGNIKTREVQFKEVGWFDESKNPYFGDYHWFKQKFFWR